jgi:hypothetical protein
MPIDSHCQTIFGRTFLNTARANIDCRKGTISLRFGEEVIQFQFSKFEHKPIDENFDKEQPEEEGYLTDLVVVLYDTPEDEMERSLVKNDNVIRDTDKEEMDEYLDSSRVVHPFMNRIYEIPERKRDEALPPPELKHLLPDLKYRFLYDTNKYPFIISANPTKKEEEQLMMVFKMHCKALGYSLADLKGISPSIAIHRIFMEQGAQPVVDFQSKLKPDIKEVVRKETICLLDAGIIYHVGESDWVSHVHCVPKKGGFIVVPKKHNEMVPTPTGVGHRMCIDFRKINVENRKDHYPLPFID